MELKPWYKVVTPREDLREGKPLDASEFAVHLDQVRDGRAPTVYQQPAQFFERTYLTQSLTALAVEVIRRLSGEKTETSAVFNMATQFGGGKTHALAMLYHLAERGPAANDWHGVRKLLDRAGLSAVPRAATAVFVGTEFDSLTGRGGGDGTPVRRTPWGEIAYQLAGQKGLAVLAEHEKQMTAPAGDVIRQFLPKDQPCLILLDELMNYVSRSRKSGMGAQLHSFLHNLSEEARGRDDVVLAVSIPASELEMTAEDQSDHERFKKLLDRLGKAVMVSAEAETSEIIRRRLFEWHGVPDEGRKVVAEYADWVVDHRQQIPRWFPADRAREAFEATYPFSPMTLSVFERKWQALPRFQQTRGVLRLLALWVSRAYQEGFKGAHRDPLIGLGTAPLDDPFFRAAMFEQLGEHRWEAVVTADIQGKSDAHAIRLDEEAVDAIKHSRLHRKVATTIFFESNGGHGRTDATVPEIRLAVAEPDLDIGNVETALEALATSCYYLAVDGNHYKFKLSPNLNKVFADRRANIQSSKISDRVRSEVEKVFGARSGVERIFFPNRSSQIPDRPVLTLVILGPDESMEDDKQTAQLIDSMTREHATTARRFKSALIWCVAAAAGPLHEEARKALAWEEIWEENRHPVGKLDLDEDQKRKLFENLRIAQRDLGECVWRTYKTLVLLDRDNTLRVIDLGLMHSSSSDPMVAMILNRLRQDGDLVDSISPNFLIRNWPAFKEWSTKAVRDAFFASPKLPRVLTAEVIRDTITRGVNNGVLAYVGKTESGGYEPFVFGGGLSAGDVEISEDVFIITRETAEEYKRAKETKDSLEQPVQVPPRPSVPETVGGPPSGWELASPIQAPAKTSAEAGLIPAGSGLSWAGDIPPQKWMNFYTRVLSRFATEKSLKLTLKVQVAPEGGISPQKIEETRIALRELGLPDDLEAT